MYACLHLPGPEIGAALFDLALTFSPVVERAADNTTVFSIAPLRKFIGSPHQIASEICRAGHERKVEANLAIAANPDTAILSARNFSGVTLIAPGEERFKLAGLPLPALFTHDVPVDAALLDVFERWGLRTCGDLAALPESGVAERLGSAGVYLRNLACGKIDRPLRVAAPVTSYEERMELEHPIRLLEPLLFLLGRTCSELCARLRSQSRAARALESRFELDARQEYRCELEFAVPLVESQTILKLLQLHLERHPPAAPILAFTLRMQPAAPRRVQGGFFLPPTPPPDKLQVTLARIAGMVGKENTGTPQLENTHRPDAFQMVPFHPAAAQIQEPQTTPAALRLAIRLFRPALPARVIVVGAAPKNVIAPGVRGNVMHAAGPWKTSGEWWSTTCWNREEWDVALEDGALYRIYCVAPNHEWYVVGVYD